MTVMMMAKNANYEVPHYVISDRPPSYYFFLEPNYSPRSTVPIHPGSVLPYVTDSASRGFERRGPLNCSALHNNHFPRAGANLIYLAEPTALTVKVLQ